MRIRCSERSLSSLRAAWPAALLLSALLVSNATICGAETSGAYEIAVLADLTGVSAVTGTTLVGGIRAALEGENRQGGVNGRKIDLTIRDDTNNAATGISAARRLLENKDTLALIGNGSSAVATGLGPLAPTYKAAILSVAFPDGLVTPPQTYLYMAVAGFVQQADAQASFIASRAGHDGFPAKPKVAILRLDSPASTVWGNEVNAALGRLGIEVAADQKFALGSSDVSAQAARIGEAHPDVVVAFLIPTELSMTNNALKAVGVPATVPLINYSFGSARAVMEAAGSERPYVALTNFNATDTGPMRGRMQADADAIKANPGAGSFVEGYAEGLITLDVLKRCGADCTRETFAQTMDHTNTDLNGFAFGPIIFSATQHAGITRLGFQQVTADKKLVTIGEPQKIR